MLMLAGAAAKDKGGVPLPDPDPVVAQAAL